MASSVVPRPPSDAGEAQGEEEKRTRFLLTPSIRSPRRSDLQKTATLFEAAFAIADGEEIIVDVYELVTLGGGSSTVWIGRRGRDGIELMAAVARQVAEVLLRAADVAEGKR